MLYEVITETERRKGHRRPEGQDPGLGTVRLATGLDRLGLTLMLTLLIFPVVRPLIPSPDFSLVSLAIVITSYSIHYTKLYDGVMPW